MGGEGGGPTEGRGAAGGDRVLLWEYRKTLRDYPPQSKSIQIVVYSEGKLLEITRRANTLSLRSDGITRDRWRDLMTSRLSGSRVPFQREA
eukprot:762775-Hanusia_phi.AAC.2